MADNKTDDKNNGIASTGAGTTDNRQNPLEQTCPGCLTTMLKCECTRRKRSNVVTRNTLDDTPMEGVEEVATKSHTTSGKNTGPPPGLTRQLVANSEAMGNSSTSSGAPPLAPATTVQPQTVQDPLHTGLTQAMQFASSNDSTNHYQSSQPTAAASTTTLSYDPQRMYEDYIEDELTRNGELILAAHTTRTISRTQIPTWHTVSTATETSHIRALLTALAFDLGTTDPWNTLGLSRLEGPKPSIHMLQSRRDVALKLIESCTSALHDTAQQEMTTIKDNLNKACNDCCSNLEINAQERRSLKGNIRNIPRWMEPSEDLLEYLAEHMQHNGRLALHLSNLKGTNITTYPGAIDVNSSRQLHSHLCGPPEEIERTLTRWGDLPLLTWAPIDNGQLLKVAACVRKLHNTRAIQAPLILATPFDPFPACQKVSDITDVWDHPLLHTKWKDVVVDTTLLTPPTRIVVSGIYAPMHTQKCICLFTLGLPQAPTIPRLMAWRPNFFNFSAGPTITIDTPTQCRHAVRAIVDTLELPALQSVDNPRPSLGTTRDTPRSTLQLHFETNRISPIHMETLLKWLSNTLHDYQAIIGLQSTMASPTAMLVDVMSPTAGYTHASLSWSTLVLSPRLLLVETRSDASTWSTSLTTAWQLNPATSGIKIRYRPSANTPPLFAQVQATAADIASVKARKSHTFTKPSMDKPPTLQATISMPLGTCGPSEQWLPMFMERVANNNNLPLQPSTSDSGLDVHRWKAVTSYEGTWTGKVIVQLATIEELHHMHRTLHGQGIEIQHHLAGIYVDSDHVDLSSRATGATSRSS